MKFFCSLLIFCTCFVFRISAHGLMKRDAGDGKFYVFASREGCVSVTSAEPCPVSWKLNPDVAKVYEYHNKAASRFLAYYNFSWINDQCRNDLKAIFCLRANPRCLEDGSRDYGDAKTTCEKIYDSCPNTLVKIYKELKWCEHGLTGKHAKGDCVAPPRTIKGACPQPKYKMTPYFFESHYEKQSQNYVSLFEDMENATYPDDKTRVYSSACVSKLKEMMCNPLVCSADEKSLLVKNDRTACKNLVKDCLDGVLAKSSAYPSVFQGVKQIKRSLDFHCNWYPDNSTETQSAPPTVRPPTVRPAIVTSATVTPATVTPPTVRPPTVRPPTVRSPTVRPPTVRPPTVRPPTVRPPNVTPATVTPATVTPATVTSPTSSANSHLPQLVLLLLLFHVFFVMFPVYDEI